MPWCALSEAGTVGAARGTITAAKSVATARAATAAMSAL
jgi:hypothetical protein